MFHLDAFAAARRHGIDLSDYQASSAIFPVVFKPAIDTGQQSVLWAMEGPSERTIETLTWLQRSLPVPIDYVILVGEETSAESARTDMAQVLTFLSANMHLVGTSRSGPFVRVYQRIDQ